MNDEVFLEICLDIPRDRTLDLTPQLDNGVLEKMTGYYEVLFEEGHRSDRSILRLYFPAGYSRASEEVKSLLEKSHLDDWKLEETPVFRKDYMEAYKAHYEPLRLSRRFGVIPGWHRGTEEAESFAREFDELIPLYLDPGLAFGTGRHATTKMMVEFIDGEEWSGLRVLDAGCGSGILALAVLKMGAGSVLAFDIDGNAVQATAYNLAENGISTDRFLVLEGGWDLPQLTGDSFDVILANITLNIFVEYRSIINRIPARRLVVSGLLVETREIFLELFSEQWECRGEKTEDGWILLDLRRKVDIEVNPSV